MWRSSQGVTRWGRWFTDGDSVSNSSNASAGLRDTQRSIVQSRLARKPCIPASNIIWRWDQTEKGNMLPLQELLHPNDLHFALMDRLSCEVRFFSAFSFQQDTVEGAKYKNLFCFFKSLFYNEFVFELTLKDYQLGKFTVTNREYIFHDSEHCNQKTNTSAWLKDKGKLKRSLKRDPAVGKENMQHLWVCCIGSLRIFPCWPLIS